MAELNIPQEHQAKFVSFVQLSDEIKGKIFESLNEFEVDATPDLLADSLILHIEKLDRNEALDIVVIYLNLINAKNSFGISLNEFILLLERALLRTGILELKPNKKILSDFEKLLSSSSKIDTKLKITSLMSENLSTFLDVKLYQDIRPCFDEKNNLVGSAIIHNLKLVVNENNDKKEIYVALDDNDLLKLLEEIQKAQLNTKLINANFPNAKFIDL
jgi:hypothetical protein